MGLETYEIKSIHLNGVPYAPANYVITSIIWVLNKFK